MKKSLIMVICLWSISTLYAQQDSLHQQFNASAVFKVVDEMPRFPDQGCEELSTIKKKMKCADEKLAVFLKHNIQYPSNAEIAGVEGFAVVSFLVNTDGSISDTKLLHNPGWGMGTEALRIVDLMVEQNIRWIPGRQRGDAVKVTFNLPVEFKLKNRRK